MLTDPVPTPPPTCAVTVIRGEHGIIESRTKRKPWWTGARDREHGW